MKYVYIESCFTNHLKRRKASLHFSTTFSVLRKNLKLREKAYMIPTTIYNSRSCISITRCRCTCYHRLKSCLHTRACAQQVFLFFFFLCYHNLQPKFPKSTSSFYIRGRMAGVFKIIFGGQLNHISVNRRNTVRFFEILILVVWKGAVDCWCSPKQTNLYKWDEGREKFS